MLDIAGGSGIYACCIVAAHPHMKATVYDRSPVDRVAAKLIAKRACSDRVDVAVGDMFRDSLAHGLRHPSLVERVPRLGRADG